MISCSDTFSRRKAQIKTRQSNVLKGVGLGVSYRQVRACKWCIVRTHVQYGKWNMRLIPGPIPYKPPLTHEPSPLRSLSLLFLTYSDPYSPMKCPNQGIQRSIRYFSVHIKFFGDTWAGQILQLITYQYILRV